jgi:hypothetical protein
VLPLDLLADSGLRLDDLVLAPNVAVALLVSTTTSAACPRCGTASGNALASNALGQGNRIKLPLD